MFEIIIKENDVLEKIVSDFKTEDKAIRWCLDDLNDLFFEHHYEEDECEFEDNEGELWEQTDDTHFWFKYDEDDIRTYEIKEVK